MTTISRAALHVGSPVLDLVDVDVKDPGPGEILVRMGASGVCGSDRHVLDGDWRMPSPTVMGHEGAGTVVAVGDGVTTARAGDHVILAWFAPCMKCRACAAGRTWVCTGSHSETCLLPDGSSPMTRDGEPVYPYLAVGSMSEYTVVPEQAAVVVPDGVPFEIAALLGCSVSTGFGAVVNDAGVEPGRAAVVIGAGGVGLSIIMALGLAGANPIVAVDVTDEALELAASFGATHLVRAGDDAAAQIREATDGGADYAFEAIGRPESIAGMPELLARGGTGVVVGLPPEDRPVAIDALALAEEGKRLIGSNYGSTVPRRDFPLLASLYLAGKLPVDRLITHRVGLDGVNGAFDAMRAGARGRTVVVF
ncbi:alcohol dehydrogenase catalytic domain-containing protein [Zhihengliuella halotolerans]|uniref:S-(Hydroxymethyl)glutathione dehydrogenase/alcohol dehydrogenase n=1 Tax=Zhihengliuella halotolerans TaxID=370736 RepID=A0A4Q8AF40_9MICC|nr:alcohol dehydrogenase catalytic domain-containing protein [Zhihengliuella halotolerans]RZU62283.1 S-(hydroxymethyl)glutathione dehydrogenase/alcohol dehydrogenase [Zhihengliuella halotolerans]